MRNLTDVIQKTAALTSSTTKASSIRDMLKSKGQYGKCEKHPRYDLLMYEGDIVCPLCQREQNEKELEAELKAEYKNLSFMKTKGMLSQESVLDSTEVLYASFDNFDINTPKEEKVRSASLTVVQMVKENELYNKGTEELKKSKQRSEMTEEELKRVDTPPKTINVWYTGLPGVGKSHLAMSVLKELNKDGHRKCLFVSVKEMFRRIKEGFGNNEFLDSYYIKKLVEADYLVLDDLGKETGGEYTDRSATDFTNKILNAVVDGRRDKTTLYTLNMTASKLRQVYDPAIVSRMMSNQVVINYTDITDKRTQGRIELT